MVKARRVNEETVRAADYIHHETLETDKGEVDVYRADGDPDAQVEIRVFLSPDRVGRPSPLLTYASISISNIDGTGRPLQIIGEDGRPLDIEMSEVLAYEMIEYRDLAMSYIDGREPGKVRAMAQTVDAVEEPEPF